MTLAIVLARLTTLVALGAIAGMLTLARRAGWPVRRRWLIASVALAFASVIAQSVLQATLAAGEDGLTVSVFAAFLASTWGGKIILIRLGLIAALACGLAYARTPRGQFFSLALAVAALLSAPLAGHASTAAPIGLSLILHALHATAASLWIGGVLVLALSAGNDRASGRFKKTVGAFSPLALAFVLVAVIAGLGAAFLQIERPAALVGTLYGQMLLVKVFFLLVPALLAAAWLRWRYVKGSAGENSAAPILAIEAAFGLGVMALGCLIAQTVPGRHDAIVWPLPFRFAPWVAWRADGAPQDILASIVVGAAALIFAVILFAKGRVFRSAAVICAGVGGACLAVLAYLVSVPAFPTTFAMTPVAYDASAIMRGRHVYLSNCVVCHGETGHGDGPGAGVLPIAPADLTARHTEDHTAGDMFWWISNGTASGAMPGVGDAIDDEDKWNLITYIRALSSGYLGRYVPKRVIPRLAWLAAIDFTYQTEAGGLASLNDWREKSVVLLVLARDMSQIERVRELIALAPELEKARTQMLIVTSADLAAALGPLPANATVISADTADILDAWSLYRRTFWDMDPGDLAPAPAYMEFLIDRFGYVRLRGRSDDQTLSPIKTLALQAAYLAEEPQLRPPPDEHVH